MEDLRVWLAEAKLPGDDCFKPLSKARARKPSSLDLRSAVGSEHEAKGQGQSLQRRACIRYGFVA